MVRGPRKPGPKLVKQPTAAPTRKMQFAGYGGLIASATLAPFLVGVVGLDEVIIWFWSIWSDKPMPASVAGAIVGAISATAAAFAAGYQAKAHTEDEGA